MAIRSRIGTVTHAFFLGWVYPVRMLGTYFRPVPVNQKLTYCWSTYLMRRFRIRLRRIGEEPVLAGRRCLYLCPHRSTTDLFLHKFLTDGHGATLSRAGMGVYFPMTWLTTRTDRSTWFFNRGKRRTAEEFYEWLDDQFDRCPLNGLIVYPEGTRHLGDHPLPMKVGMIHYAHSRGLPVQIIATQRTERIINEKHWSYAYDQEIAYRIDPPIDPATFQSRAAFRAEVRRAFERAYDEVVMSD